MKSRRMPVAGWTFSDVLAIQMELAIRRKETCIESLRIMERMYE